MKKLFILIIVLAVVGGGTYYYITNKDPGKNKPQDTVSERAQERSFRFEGLSEGTSEDLVIGEEVTVRGTDNQDGSITATMIFIGILEDRPESPPEFSLDTERDFSNRPMPEGFNPEEFQNLSQEERRQRMQEFRANADDNFRARGGRMAGGAFIRGEIIDKDEVSITVKLIDSGSKLIFYSDDTEIRIQE